VPAARSESGFASDFLEIERGSPVAPAALAQYDRYERGSHVSIGDLNSGHKLKSIKNGGRQRETFCTKNVR
jgi:hypothetical protein